MHFVDNKKITIGNCVMIAPNVQIYTAYHPVLPEERYICERDENDPIYYNTCADPVAYYIEHLRLLDIL